MPCAASASTILPSGVSQHRGHQAERAEALRHRVGLHVAVVVLAGPDIAARPFQRRRDHVVDQPVLVGQIFFSSNFGLELLVEDLLEDVLEAAVIDLEDGVLGREIERIRRGRAHSSTRRGRSRGSTRRDCTSPSRRRRRATSKTSCSIVLPSSPTNLIDSLPLPGTLKSVARYWSP